ncbi:hypothetical protein DFH09DRAFT_1356870 [Mycena vulgaris]|nr:hypothetical protein DFH09DRAFT_1356870 [Mycena vulgaris]
MPRTRIALSCAAHTLSPAARPFYTPRPPVFLVPPRRWMYPSSGPLHDNAPPLPLRADPPHVAKHLPLHVAQYLPAPPRRPVSVPRRPPLVRRRVSARAAVRSYKAPHILAYRRRTRRRVSIWLRVRMPIWVPLRIGLRMGGARDADADAQGYPYPVPVPTRAFDARTQYPRLGDPRPGWAPEDDVEDGARTGGGGAPLGARDRRGGGRAARRSVLRFRKRATGMWRRRRACQFPAPAPAPSLAGIQDVVPACARAVYLVESVENAEQEEMEHAEQEEVEDHNAERGVGLARIQVTRTTKELAPPLLGYGSEQADDVEVGRVEGGADDGVYHYDVCVPAPALLEASDCRALASALPASAMPASTRSRKTRTQPSTATARACSTSSALDGKATSSALALGPFPPRKRRSENGARRWTRRWRCSCGRGWALARTARGSSRSAQGTEQLGDAVYGTPSLHVRGDRSERLVMEDGWTRVNSSNIRDDIIHRTIASKHHCPLQSRAWLTQANYTFNHLGITSNYKDYIFVHSVQYQLTLSGTGGVPSGYLFLCPLRDLQSEIPSHFRVPECPAYWSLDSSGARRLSTEEAEELRFPRLHFNMEAKAMTRTVKTSPEIWVIPCTKYQPGWTVLQTLKILGYSGEAVSEQDTESSSVNEDRDSGGDTESWNGDKDPEQEGILPDNECLSEGVHSHTESGEDAPPVEGMLSLSDEIEVLKRSKACRLLMGVQFTLILTLTVIYLYDEYYVRSIS